MAEGRSSVSKAHWADGAVERANRNGYHALVVPSAEHVCAEVGFRVPPGTVEDFNALLHAELAKAPS